jgi:hypothetical protein
MNKTLILKEIHDLRYVLAIAGLAIFILVTSLFGFTPTGKIMYLLGYETGIPQDIIRETDIGAQPPFSRNGYINPVSIATCALALILGFTQGLHENRSGRWQFLLSLPITRIEILQSKILVGLGVWLATVLVLVGAGLLYSSIPGRVPYPMEWWVVLRACQWLPLGAALYMGALYCGIRRVHWLGTRLFPLIGSLTIIFFCLFIMIKMYLFISNQKYYSDFPEFLIGAFFIQPFSISISLLFYFQIKNQFIEA